MCALYTGREITLFTSTQHPHVPSSSRGDNGHRGQSLLHFEITVSWLRICSLGLDVLSPKDFEIFILVLGSHCSLLKDLRNRCQILRSVCHENSLSQWIWGYDRSCAIRLSIYKEVTIHGLEGGGGVQKRIRELNGRALRHTSWTLEKVLTFMMGKRYICGSWG